MSTVDKKTLEKIRKLLAKAKDSASSEAEVEIFMKKARELMMKNQLEEGDIDIHPADINKDTVFSELWKAFKYKHKNFEWELIDTISGFYNCKLFKKDVYDFGAKDYKKTRRTRFSIIGRQDDRKIVAEMYDVLSVKFLTLSDIRYKEYQVSKRKELLSQLESAGLSTKGISTKYLEGQKLMTRKGTWVASYLSGCINGISSALRDQQKDTLKLENDKKSWGLIVSKIDALIDARVPELIGKVKTTNSISNGANFDSRAYQEGVKDGKTNPNTKMLN